MTDTYEFMNLLNPTFVYTAKTNEPDVKASELAREWHVPLDEVVYDRVATVNVPLVVKADKPKITPSNVPVVEPVEPVKLNGGEVDALKKRTDAYIAYLEERVIGLSEQVQYWYEKANRYGDIAFGTEDKE